MKLGSFFALALLSWTNTPMEYLSQGIFCQIFPLFLPQKDKKLEKTEKQDFNQQMKWVRLFRSENCTTEAIFGQKQKMAARMKENCVELRSD